jgi:hypothetical protein
MVHAQNSTASLTVPLLKCGALLILDLLQSDDDGVMEAPSGFPSPPSSLIDGDLPPDLPPTGYVSPLDSPPSGSPPGSSPTEYSSPPSSPPLEGDGYESLSNDRSLHAEYPLTNALS